MLNKLNKFYSYLVNNEKKTLLILVFLAILFRAIFVLFSHLNIGDANWSDDWYYLFLGEEISKGNWQPGIEAYPQMIVGPVIPLLITIFIKLFNNAIIPMYLYNVLITSFLILVLYYLGREIFNKKTGMVMAFWGLFFVESYKYSPHLLKEPTLFLLVPLTIFLLIKAVRNSGSFKFIILSAVSFTLLIHTDERFIIYLPVFPLGFVLTKPVIFKDILKSMSLWVGFVLFLMLPWGIRNYLVFDQIVVLTPRTTVITSKLWGKNLFADISYSKDDLEGIVMEENRYKEAVEFGKMNGIKPYEYNVNEARLRAFVNFWQPVYFKPTFIQFGFRPQKWSLFHNTASLLFYGFFLPFYVTGIVLLIRRKHFVGLFLASIPLIHSIMHSYLVWPLERYRSPVTFIVVMIGIYTLFETLAHLNKKHLKK